MSHSYADVGTTIVQRSHHYPTQQPRLAINIGGTTLDSAKAFLNTSTPITRQNLILGGVVAAVLGAIGSAYLKHRR